MAFIKLIKNTITTNYLTIKLMNILNKALEREELMEAEYQFLRDKESSDEGITTNEFDRMHELGILLGYLTETH